MVLKLVKLGKVVKMAFTISTIVRIKDFQVYQGITCLNVYHYKLDSVLATPDLAALSTQWQTTVLTPVRATQNPNLQHFRILLEMVNNGVQFLDQSVALNGTKAGGNDAPTFVNASIQLTRSDTETRSGRKAITGLDEGDFTGNALTAAAIALQATSLAGMVTTLTTGDGNWAPIILGPQTGGDPNGYTVGLPTTGFVRPNLTTQNSRKT